MWLRHRRGARASLRAMDPIAVAARAAARRSCPDLPLREGATMMARVASRGEHARRASCSPAMPLTAELPDEVQAGATLRLRSRRSRRSG